MVLEQSRKMQLVEQHIIEQNNPMWKLIDAAAFASKNLYNLANYHIRQAFIFEDRWIRLYGTEGLEKLLNKTEAYKSLPAKVAQQVLILLDRNWTSFFAATREYKENPSKFLGRPKLPQYKGKEEGRNILVYTEQAISTKQLRVGLIVPSGLPIAIRTKQKNIKQVRIVPRKDHYVAEVVYVVPEQKANVDSSLVAAIDLGLDNLATLTSNKQGFAPLLVSGRYLKSLNQFFNKRKAELQAKLTGKREISPLIQKLANNRTRRINHYMHTASHRIVKVLLREGIGTLVIGRNPEWKQEINMGKRNNQAFVQIPQARFVQMLQYKCQLVGIAVVEREESYTSKTSFLDLAPIQKRETYLGKRVKRGLFRSSNETKINADVNGSYNILRKAFPGAFANGIVGAVVLPLPLGMN